MSFSAWAWELGWDTAQDRSKPPWDNERQRSLHLVPATVGVDEDGWALGHTWRMWMVRGHWRYVRGVLFTQA